MADEATKKILEEISETKDLKRALELMIELQNGHVKREYQGRPVEYDSKTGKPIRYETVQERFNDKFYFGGEGWGGERTVKLTEEVQKEIMRGPVSIRTPNGGYYAKFEEEDHSGSDRGYFICCVGFFISLQKAREL